MTEICEPWQRILMALANGPKAWLSPGELSRIIGEDLETTSDRLADLDEAGWVAIWDRPDGPAATLSPLAATRMAVKLVEIGPDEIPRWAPSGDPEPPSPRARHVCGAARSADLEFVVDPQELPELALERAELSARRALLRGAGSVHRFRWPTLVVGQGVSPWREVGPGPSCPGCGGLPLRSDTYCLCCGRWGLDSTVDCLTENFRTPASASTPPRPTESRRMDEVRRIERARRKLRRLGRLQARGSAEELSRKRKRSEGTNPEKPVPLSVTIHRSIRVINAAGAS